MPENGSSKSGSSVSESMSSNGSSQSDGPSSQGSSSNRSSGSDSSGSGPASRCVFEWFSAYDCDTAAWSIPTQSISICRSPIGVVANAWEYDGTLCGAVYRVIGETDCTDDLDCNTWPAAPPAPTLEPPPGCCGSSNGSSNGSSAPSSGSSDSGSDDGPSPCPCAEGTPPQPEVITVGFTVPATAPFNIEDCWPNPRVEDPASNPGCMTPHAECGDCDLVFVDGEWVEVFTPRPCQDYCNDYNFILASQPGLCLTAWYPQQGVNVNLQVLRRAGCLDYNRQWVRWVSDIGGQLEFGPPSDHPAYAAWQAVVAQYTGVCGFVLFTQLGGWPDGGGYCAPINDACCTVYHVKTTGNLVTGNYAFAFGYDCRTSAAVSFGNATVS